MTRAALKEVGKTNAEFRIGLNIVEMLYDPDYVYILFDIFRPEYDQNLRPQMRENPQQPIHYVSRKSGTYFMRKDARIEKFAFREYTERRNRDKGELPLFHDCKHPPTYDIDGIRYKVQWPSQEEWRVIRAQWQREREEEKEWEAQALEAGETFQADPEEGSERSEHYKPTYDQVPGGEVQWTELMNKLQRISGDMGKEWEEKSEEKSEDRQHDKPTVDADSK